MQQFSSLLSWRLFTAQHVLYSWSGRPRTQHGYHHDTKVKPDAATGVIELLMMGGRTPEICWAVNKRQDNKLEKLLHLVGDSSELYDDAPTYKPQIFPTGFRKILKFHENPLSGGPSFSMRTEGQAGKHSEPDRRCSQSWERA